MPVEYDGILELEKGMWGPGDKSHPVSMSDMKGSYLFWNGKGLWPITSWD